MKLRLSLTISFTRDRAEPQGAAEEPTIFESQGAAIERAWPHPVGFTRELPFEQDRGR